MYGYNFFFNVGVFQLYFHFFLLGFDRQCSGHFEYSTANNVKTHININYSNAKKALLLFLNRFNFLKFILTDKLCR